MHIVLMGMNHKTAPVEVRERLAAACAQRSNPVALRTRLRHVDEIFFLSTCNRVEFLFTSARPEGAIQEVRGLLKAHLGQPLLDVDPHLYVFQDMEAVRHLFRVASSLDSMVVGEPQILGQIKSAYREATVHRSVGVVLNRLLHKSFSVAKRVRSETLIGAYAVSISYAAVELARKIFGALEGKSVLLIGAGEMAELAAEHFLAQGVRRIKVANRTLERAMELARRFNAGTIPFSQVADNLKEVDIVLSSTGSPETILNLQDVRPRMKERRNRPLFLIDIAVPRDIDPRINELDNVYLYDIDDLQGIVDLNRGQRLKEAEKAEHIIEMETVSFQQWFQTLEVVPTIIALRRKAETIREAELRKTFAHLEDLDDRQREAVTVLTEAIVRKLLHDPILFLKKKSHRESKKLYVDFTQQLFNLSDGNGSDAAEPSQELL